MSKNFTLEFTNNTLFQNEYYVYYYYAYVHHIATFAAAFMNIICGIVFFQRELLTSGPFFQYSLLNSFGSATGMLLLVSYSFIRCGPLCHQGSNYLAAIVELAVMYIGNFLYFGGSLVQIAISFQLYLSITQKFKKLNSVAPIKIMGVFTLISIIMGLSILFAFKINQLKYLTISNGTAHWEISYQVLLDRSNLYLVAFAIFFVVISNKIFLVVLIIVNILLYVELRKIMKRKQKMTMRYSRRRNFKYRVFF